MFFIYVLIEPDTFLVRYVGLTTNPRRRKKEHAGSYYRKRLSYSHYRNWREKLHSENKCPIFAILAIYSTADEAKDAERVWITTLRSIGFDLVNWDEGGKRYNCKRTVTWGEAISRGKRGKPGHKQSPEAIAKTVAAHRGSRRSLESRQRMSEAQKRIIENGYTPTSESLAKRSESMKRTRALRFWSSRPVAESK